jgi:CMP-N-acetylneuraminic acid synthetase
MKILVVIPARAGSKGIKGKCTRVLCGKPLWKYALENALSLKQEVDIVVTTDIKSLLSDLYEGGYRIMQRKPELCEDHVPLAPVLYDAVIRTEFAYEIKYDIVIMLQPTSPTLRAETLQAALSLFTRKKINTMLSAKQDNSLCYFWAEGRYILFQNNRINRQFNFKSLYFETGGFFITSRKNITENNFIDNPDLWLLSKDEAIDIDDEYDWMCAEAVLKKRNPIRI